MSLTTGSTTEAIRETSRTCSGRVGQGVAADQVEHRVDLLGQLLADSGPAE